MAAFGERLKEARLARGWSQAKLAEELGVEPSAVNRWEKGGGIDASRMPGIAEKLGKSVEWLLGKNTADLEKRFADLEARFSAKFDESAKRAGRSYALDDVPSEVIEALAEVSEWTPLRVRQVVLAISGKSPSSASQRKAKG